MDTLAKTKLCKSARAGRLGMRISDAITDPLYLTAREHPESEYWLLVSVTTFFEQMYDLLLEVRGAILDGRAHGDSEFVIHTITQDALTWIE